MTTCPSCQTSIPTEPGYIAWCDHCGWNVQPTRPELPHTLLGRAFVSLGRHSGQQLFEQLVERPDLQRGRSTATMLAFVGAGLVHGLTLALAVGGVLLIVGSWFTLSLTLLGALMLLVAWALRPRFGRLEAAPLARSEAPALFALIDRVAQALGHAPVETLVLDEAFNASYSRVGLQGQPVLTLGLPLVAILEPQQQVALIAHELAHGVNGDPVRGRFIGSAIAALEGWYLVLHPGRLWEPERGLMAYPVLVSNVLMLGLAQLANVAVYGLSLLAWRESQRAEYLADDLAAQVAGAEAKLGLLEALTRYDVVDTALQRMALGRDAGDDLLAALEQAAASIPPRERERLRRAGLLENARVESTHPPTALRTAMIERRPHGSARITVSPEQSAALRTELQRLAVPIRQHLLDHYRSRLYAG